MTTQAPLDGQDMAEALPPTAGPPVSADPVAPTNRQHRAAATTVGILYLTGTAAGVLSGVVTLQVNDARDSLASASTHQGAVATGALLVLLMGLSLAFVPVVLLPILRRVDEVLAVGYLVIRGAVEATCYVLLAVGWLLLVPLDGAVPASAGTRNQLGDILINGDATNAVLALVFCLGAALFYILLHRSGIVPRWIALWGLLSIPVYLLAALLAMYGVVETNSTTQTLLFLPMFGQEIVLAIWMIARGFRPIARAGRRRESWS